MKKDLTVLSPVVFKGAVIGVLWWIYDHNYENRISIFGKICNKFKNKMI